MIEQGGLTTSGGTKAVLGKTTKEQGGSSEAGATDVSVISKGLRIEGNCVSDGRLRIEGRVSGNVVAKGVELMAGGHVDGDVVVAEGAEPQHVFLIDGKVTGAVHAAHVEVGRGGSVDGGVGADEAVIRGRVRGGVVARKRLALEETAEVEGDVHARRLALKDGGRVNGNIRMGDRASLEEPRAAHEPPPAERPEGGPEKAQGTEAEPGRQVAKAEA